MLMSAPANEIKVAAPRLLESYGVGRYAYFASIQEASIRYCRCRLEWLSVRVRAGLIVIRNVVNSQQFSLVGMFRFLPYCN